MSQQPNTEVKVDPAEERRLTLIESATEIICSLDDSLDRQIVRDAERFLSQQFLAETKMPEPHA